MYDSCIHSSSHSVLTHDVEYNTIIYCIGYSLSIIVLTIAVIIFVTFKWVKFDFLNARLKKNFHIHVEAIISRNLLFTMELFEIIKIEIKIIFAVGYREIKILNRADIK